MVQYQVRLFVEPGLFAFERKVHIYISILSLSLALTSSIFTYFLLLPAACKFFLSFETASVQVYLNARMGTYLTFVLGLLSGCYFFFQLPILVLIFFKYGLINEETLVKKRKLSYLFSLVLSILISPPDFLSQILLIIPFFFFYELTIFISLFIKVVR
jgi:sec-independent protein translocase protein TatC